jgi:vancomycin permeability regulator SanA
MNKRVVKFTGKKMIVIGKGLLLLVLAGVLLVLLVNFHMGRVAAKDFTTLEELSWEIEAGEREPADAALVLGAQVKPDGQMSLMLRERVDVGIELYQAGVVKKLIMSGDHGRVGYDEVNTMKDYAISKGVPSEDVFMDHAGFSTYESMYRAKAIFEVESMVVVTQEYHLYRAVYDGRAFGMEVAGVPCDTAVYHGDAYRKCREMLARLKDFGYTLVKPEPTFLGEAIPVSGDGNLTNDR